MCESTLLSAIVKHRPAASTAVCVPLFVPCLILPVFLYSVPVRGDILFVLFVSRDWVGVQAVAQTKVGPELVLIPRKLEACLLFQESWFSCVFSYDLASFISCFN